MANWIFPWMIFLSVLSALAFCLYDRLLPEKAKIGRSLLLGLFWTTLLVGAAAATRALLLPEGAFLWTTDFIPMDSGGRLVARLGLELAAPGTVMCWLAVAAFGYLFFADTVIARNRSPALECGAALGAAAVALAWFSSGLWMALVAQWIAVLSGAVVLSRFFPGAALTHLRERSVGVILLFLGAAFCAAAGSRLEWGDFAVLPLPRIGLALIVVGALLQLQIFPAILRECGSTGRRVPPARVALLVAVPSAWTGFGILLRVADAVAAADLSPVLIPIILGMVLLTLLSALGRADVQSGFSLVLSAFAGLAAAVLMGAGPRAGGSFFFSSQLTLAAAAIFLGGMEKNIAHRLTAALTLLVLLGCPGFVSSGALAALLVAAPSGMVLVLTALTWILTAVALMRILAARASPIPEELLQALGIPAAGSPSARILPVAVMAILSLAVFWTGDPIGRFADPAGAVTGMNWAAQIFGTEAAAGGEIPPVGFWGWGVLLIALLAADVPARLSRIRFRHLAIPAAGYGIPRLCGLFAAGFEALANGVSGAVEKHLVPVLVQAPRRIFAAFCERISRADRALIEGIDRAVRTLVEVPAKGLQVLQSGSIQFYILFAVGITLALWLHFASQPSP